MPKDNELYTIVERIKRRIKKPTYRKIDEKELDFTIIDQIGSLLENKFPGPINLQCPEMLKIIEEREDDVVAAVKRSIWRTEKAEQRRAKRFVSNNERIVVSDLYGHKQPLPLYGLKKPRPSGDDQWNFSIRVKVRFPSDDLIEGQKTKEESQKIKYIEEPYDEFNNYLQTWEVERLDLLEKHKEEIDQCDGKYSADIERVLILNAPDKISVRKISQNLKVGEKIVRNRLAVIRNRRRVGENREEKGIIVIVD